MAAQFENIMCTNGSQFPFMSGGMGQGPLDEQTRKGLEQYSPSLGKYGSVKDEEKEFSAEEKQKRDRAKRANKIYKQVCEDVGLKACFFNNFGDWSDYIDGRMSDDQFQTSTAQRAREMMAEN